MIDETYKATKVDDDDQASRHLRTQVAIEDEETDEDGRFFGGGITQQEAQILDYVDEQETETHIPDHIDAPWVKRCCLNLERCIAKNSELRVKYADNPQKFIASEADLDNNIKSLSILSEHPHLYHDFVQFGGIVNLVGLLSHENTDIAICVLELVNELTDDDTTASDEQWNTLVDAMLEVDLLDLLVSNFKRLDEEDAVDRTGVYCGLSIIENLCSRTSTCEKLGQNDDLLNWLLCRINCNEDVVSQNRQYSAEVIAIMSQNSPLSRQKLTSLNSVDILLQLVSMYRRRDPEKGSDEEEYMENLFETLTQLVSDTKGQASFVESEGVELCLLMLKDGRKCLFPALRLIDHAAGHAYSVDTCQRIIEAGGLKVIFTLFMKRNDGRSIQHLLSIISSLLRLLPASSPERIRLLAKFVEKDYSKVAKLISLRKLFVARLSEEELRIANERAAISPSTPAAHKDALEDAWTLRKLDAGLFDRQTTDVIIAWLVAEDDGIRAQIEEAFSASTELRESLLEQIEALDKSLEESKEKAEMLASLIDCL